MSESTRIRAAAESASDTPSVAPDGDSASSSRSLSPVPALSRRQMALVGTAVVVGVLALLWLRSQRAESGIQQRKSPEQSAREQIETATQPEDSERSIAEIDIPTDPSDPLAADEAVTEELRRRGTIGSGSDDEGVSESQEG